MRITTAEQYKERFKKRGLKQRNRKRTSDYNGKFATAWKSINYQSQHVKYDGTTRVHDINQCFAPTALKPKTFKKWSER